VRPRALELAIRAPRDREHAAEEGQQRDPGAGAGE
jgi:hypothetical protein